MSLAITTGVKMFDAQFVARLEKQSTEVMRSRSRCRRSNNSISVQFSSRRTSPLPRNQLRNSRHRNNHWCSHCQVSASLFSHRTSGSELRPEWFLRSHPTKRSRSIRNQDSPWDSSRCISLRLLILKACLAILQAPRLATPTRNQASSLLYRARPRHQSRLLLESRSRMVK